MSEASREAQASLTFVEPTVLVFGDAPEISETIGATVRRLPIGPVAPGSPAAAAVFDLRTASVASFTEVRESPDVASVPLLLISDEEIPEAVYGLLRADDGVTLDSRGRLHLPRRLTTLIELGRLRLVASFADQALEHSVNGLSVVDLESPDAPLVHVTPAFERMTGYTREEMLGRNCRFLQGEDRAQPGVAELRTAVTTRAPEAVVLRNYRKDGTVFWNKLTIFPLLAHGRPTKWMAGVQHDVTALSEAREQIESLYRALVEKQRFDHAILDGVEVGIVTTDDDGRVTFVNRAAAHLLRISADAPPESVEEILGLDNSPKDLLGEECRRVLEHPLSRADGTDLDLELTVSRGVSDHDERVGFFFIFRDVREEKLRESERRRFERLAAMGTMVAGFAHEVRNPVAAIRSIAEELSEELRDAGVTVPHVRLLLQMVERIERLVRTSLQFGRPATPRRSPQRPWVIASQALSELRPRLRGGGEQIHIHADPELPDVNVDERQITQALVILLNNALESTGSASRVSLRVRGVKPTDQETRRKSDPPPSPVVRFEVIDDGSGIPPEILGQIFDPFFTTKASGTGLGLSIAQQIVSENGARLEVVSTPGVTTSFAIVVPA